MATQFGRAIRHFVCLVALVVAAACSQPQAVDAAPYAAIVQDARTGEVLYSKNAESRLHPASLTKMMTLYITFEEIQRGRLTLDTMVTVTKNAASQPPSRLGLKAGQKIAVRYLIRAAAIKSANDAASALGDHIGGGQEGFAKRMNATAKAIGMRNSSFRNANGLTLPGHLSSAADMNRLGLRLFYDYPQFYSIFSRRTADAGVAQVRTTNSRFLDSYDGADGIKTGYTVAAGFNLTASAQRGNVRIIATVFGGTSTAQRNAKMKELLDIGFNKAPSKAPSKQPAQPKYDADAELLLSEVAQKPRTQRSIAPEAVAAPVAEAPAARVAAAEPGMASSLRPAARPNAAAPQRVAAVNGSIAAGVLNAAGDQPPAGTMGLAAAADAPSTAPRPRAARVAAPEAAPEEPAMIAAIEPPPPGTLEAQAVALAEGKPVQMASNTPAPKRRSPNYDPPAQAQQAVASAEDPVVIRLSTSNARHWGVNLGKFNSRAGAERILLKTQLAESASLNEGLRKVVERAGGYEANFLGLTQEQADLACRRLQARSIQCFTMGP